uniref:Uncharacterized protein n=1 Tax=Macrostomum lignano TaxID=282301 RepID=A0A1I8G741_9PLAT
MRQQQPQPLPTPQAGLPGRRAQFCAMCSRALAAAASKTGEQVGQLTARPDQAATTNCTSSVFDSLCGADAVTTTTTRPAAAPEAAGGNSGGLFSDVSQTQVFIVVLGAGLIILVLLALDSVFRRQRIACMRRCCKAPAPSPRHAGIGLGGAGGGGGIVYDFDGAADELLNPTGDPGGAAVAFAAP